MNRKKNSKSPTEPYGVRCVAQHLLGQCVIENHTNKQISIGTYKLNVTCDPIT